MDSSPNRIALVALSPDLSIS